MPADYVALRDSCIERKKKKNGGKISDKQIQDCKKSAAIWYYKKHGKPVKHSDAEEALGVSFAELEGELDIWCEQIELFGSLEEYNDWNNGEFNNGRQ